MMATENSAIDHAGQNDVVGKLCFAGTLRARIDLAKGLAYYFQGWPIFSHISSLSLRLGRRPSMIRKTVSHPHSSAANSIRSRRYSREVVPALRLVCGPRPVPLLRRF